MALSYKKRRKTPGVEEPPQTDASTILFLSLMIIMLAFFIMLNALARPDEEAQKEALNSLFGTFGIVPSGRKGPTGGIVKDREFPGKYHTELESMSSKLNEQFGAEGLQGDIQIEIVGDDFLVTLSGDLVFESGEYKLSSVANPILDFLAERILRVDNKLRIEGHAAESSGEIPDAVRAAPDFDRDFWFWGLSVKRTLTVADALMARGAPIGRLITAGYGVTRPVASNDTNLGRAENRRVQIVVIDGARTPRLWRDTNTTEIRGVEISPFWKNLPFFGQR